MSMIFWNPHEQSDDENTRWCWLRAIEWGKWPLFISQPIAPILFLFFTWWEVALFIIVFTWFWSLIRYKYVNIKLVDLGSLFVKLKWPISIIIGIYFIVHKNYLLAVVSGLWPLFTMIAQFFSPPTKIGLLQNILMKKIGYTPITEQEL